MTSIVREIESRTINKNKHPVKYQNWPSEAKNAIECKESLKYKGSGDVMGRWDLFVFLVHNGARPSAVLRALASSGLLSADAIREIRWLLGLLERGQWTTKTTVLGPSQCETGPAKPTLPKEHVDDARAALREADDLVRGAAEAERARSLLGGRVDPAVIAGASETGAEAARAYFAKQVPGGLLMRLLHRVDSPVQLRELGVSTSSNTRLGRCQPVLSLNAFSNLFKVASRGGSGAAPLAMHVGPAYGESDQEPCDEHSGAPCRTEFVVEVDACSHEGLAAHLAADASGALWTRWARGALEVTLLAIRRASGEHARGAPPSPCLRFVSGNRSPHAWLLGDEYMQLSRRDRRACLENARQLAASDDDFFRSVVEPAFSVLGTPVAAGGLAFDATSAPRQEWWKLVFGEPDVEVACGKGHTHRVPFSVHEKTWRVAVPYDDENFPGSFDDIPMVTDVDLQEKLKRPIEILRGAVADLERNGSLSPVPLTKQFQGLEGAKWAKRRQLKRKAFAEARAAEEEDDEETRVSVAPLPVDRARLLEWIDELRAGAAPAVERVASSRKPDTTPRDRLEREINVASKILRACPADDSGIPGSVVRDSAGGRLRLDHEGIDHRDVMKSLHAESRAAVTANRLLSLDVSGAHPCVAWGALVHRHGSDEAARVAPTLGRLVLDRDGLVSRLARQYSSAMTARDLKKKLLSALNQSKDDEYHHLRKPILKALVDEREAMADALLDWPPIARYAAAIRAKAAVPGARGGRLLSLLMQAGETQLLLAAIDPLNSLGWLFVAPVNDAILLVPASADVPRDGTACEAAARCFEQAVLSKLGVTITVKVEMAPSNSTGV
jgi:hypothetical protein